MIHNKMNRRSVVQAFLAFTGLSLFGVFAGAQQKRQPKTKEAAPAEGGGEKLCKPNDGMAKSINYQHKHSDVKDAKLKVEKQGVPFEKQFCNNCVLYTKVGMQNGAEVGKCAVIPGCVVAGAGWSSSWAKKA